MTWCSVSEKKKARIGNSASLVSEDSAPIGRALQRWSGSPCSSFSASWSRLPHSDAHRAPEAAADIGQLLVLEYPALKRAAREQQNLFGANEVPIEDDVLEPRNQYRCRNPCSLGRLETLTVTAKVSRLLVGQFGGSIAGLIGGSCLALANS
jgi:hypothetical protein